MVEDARFVAEGSLIEIVSLEKHKKLTATNTITQKQSMLMAEPKYASSVQNTVSFGSCLLLTLEEAGVPNVLDAI